MSFMQISNKFFFNAFKPNVLTEEYVKFHILAFRKETRNLLKLIHVEGKGNFLNVAKD